MEYMHNIKMRLCEELEQYGDGNLSRGDLETVHMITDTIKNIDKIEGMKRGGYSRDGGYSSDGYANNSYDGGYSNRHYVRGHYSRDGYSRDDKKDRMLSDIDSMLHEGNMSTQDREVLQKARQVLGR